jgi:hypothetical protein
VALGGPENPTRRQLRRIEEASELMHEPLTLDRDRATRSAALTITPPAEAVAAVHVR